MPSAPTTEVLTAVRANDAQARGVLNHLGRPSLNIPNDPKLVAYDGLWLYNVVYGCLWISLPVICGCLWEFLDVHGMM